MIGGDSTWRDVGDGGWREGWWICGRYIQTTVIMPMLTSPSKVLVCSMTPFR